MVVSVAFFPILMSQVAVSELLVLVRWPFCLVLDVKGDAFTTSKMRAMFA